MRGRSILSALCIFHNYLLFWRCVTISSKELQINDEIRDKELRIIDTDGSQLGIMSASEALDKAAEKNLDLVKISPYGETAGLQNHGLREIPL